MNHNMTVPEIKSIIEALRKVDCAALVEITHEDFPYRDDFSRIIVGRLLMEAYVNAMDRGERLVVNSAFFAAVRSFHSSVECLQAQLGRAPHAVNGAQMVEAFGRISSALETIAGSVYPAILRHLVDEGFGDKFSITQMVELLAFSKKEMLIAFEDCRKKHEKACDKYAEATRLELVQKVEDAYYSHPIKEFRTSRMIHFGLFSVFGIASIGFFAVGVDYLSSHVHTESFLVGAGASVNIGKIALVGLYIGFGSVLLRLAKYQLSLGERDWHRERLIAAMKIFHGHCQSSENKEQIMIRVIDKISEFKEPGHDASDAESPSIMNHVVGSAMPKGGSP